MSQKRKPLTERRFDPDLPIKKLKNDFNKNCLDFNENEKVSHEIYQHKGSKCVSYYLESGHYQIHYLERFYVPLIAGG